MLAEIFVYNTCICMRQTLHVTVGSWARVAGRKTSTGPGATAALGDVGEQRAGGHLHARHARAYSWRPLANAPLRRARAQDVSQTRALLWVWLRLRVCMCRPGAGRGGIDEHHLPRPAGARPPKLRHEQMHSSIWRLPSFRGLVSETSECTTPQPAPLNRR